MKVGTLGIKSLALACPFVWLYLLFWSASISGSLVAYHVDEASIRLVFRGCSFVGAILVFILLRRTSREPKVLSVVLALTASLLTLVFFFGYDFGLPCAFFTLSSGLLGLVYAVSLVLVLLKIGGSLTSFMLVLGCASVFEGAASEAVLACMPDDVLPFFVAALPLLCLALFSLDALRMPESSAGLGENELRLNKGGDSVVGFIVPFAVIFFGMNAAFNLFQILCRAGDPFGNFHNGISMVAAGVVLMVCAKFLDVRKGMVGLIVASFALEAMSFLTASIQGFSLNGWYLLAMFFFTFFFYYSFVVGRCLLDDGKVVFPVLLAVSEGTGFASQLLASFVFDSGDSSFIILVSLYVFFAIACVAIPWFAAVWRKVEKEPENAPHDRDKEIAELLAAEHGLSLRECEIVELLGAGYKASEIAEMLFISRETARTHVKNIYRKMEVHSQREIIDKFHLKP